MAANPDSSEVATGQVTADEADTSKTPAEGDQPETTTETVPANDVSQAGQTPQDNTEQVAKHYNELKESGLGARTESRIFYLRNFNNWIKSMAIGEYLTKIKESRDYAGKITVLDLCSGKGGDLLKWSKGGIHKLVCADIAGTSVEQCEERYKSRGGHSFSAEFHTADCTKIRLKDLYKDKDMKFNLVSCQFSYHYSFESRPQAEMMLRNACESLEVGGYFIGTTPNAFEILKRLRDDHCDGQKFGNDVYSVKTEKNYKENLTPPLFGARYDFHLEGVVDCPEFLVYFPLLEEMAKKYGMELERTVPFAKYFDEHCGTDNGRGLLGRMQALEPFPPEKDVTLMGNLTEGDYTTADEYVKCKDQAQMGGRRTVGTLSQAEWEATSIYLLFAFKKVEDICPEFHREAMKRPMTEDTENVEIDACKKSRTDEPSNDDQKHTDTKNTDSELKQRRAPKRQIDDNEENPDHSSSKTSKTDESTKESESAT